MSKYIIKNCPACEFSDWEECTGYLAEGYICNDIHTEIVECQDRTDCKLKQIVELCKHDIEQWKAIPNVDILEGCVSNKILKLLDIQEME